MSKIVRDTKLIPNKNMRITERFTLFRRTLPTGTRVLYYWVRDDYMRRTGPFSTGKKLNGLTEIQIKRLENRTRLELLELYKAGKLGNSSVSFKAYTNKFFDENSKFTKWKNIEGTRFRDGIAPATIASYKKILENQLNPFFAKKTLHKITVAIIKDWMIWSKEQWSNKTINNAKGVLSIILQQAKEEGVIAYNPCLELGKLKTDKVLRVLITEDEAAEIFKSVYWKRENVRVAAFTACITGMRIGEVLALTRDDVYENYLDVKHSFSSRFGIGLCKTGNCRKVPIPSDMATMLYDIAGSKYIFEQKTQEKPFHSKDVNQEYDIVLETLNIDKQERKLDIHSFRRFFISYLERENVPEPKIRATVGHTEKTMTDLYTFWTPDMLQEVYAAQEKLYRKIIQGD